MLSYTKKETIKSQAVQIAVTAPGFISKVSAVVKLEIYHGSK